MKILLFLVHCYIILGAIPLPFTPVARPKVKGTRRVIPFSITDDSNEIGVFRVPNTEQFQWYWSLSCFHYWTFPIISESFLFPKPYNFDYIRIFPVPFIRLVWWYRSIPVLYLPSQIIGIFSFQFRWDFEMRPLISYRNCRKCQIPEKANKTPEKSEFKVEN